MGLTSLTHGSLGQLCAVGIPKSFQFLSKASDCSIENSWMKKSLISFGFIVDPATRGVESSESSDDDAGRLGSKSFRAVSQNVPGS